jgi:hypothetical protein
MARTLTGGTAAGAVLTLVLLPAIYAIWFLVKKPVDASGYQGTVLPR